MGIKKRNIIPSYFVSWSGGKDCCLALCRMMHQWGKPQYLLTMLTEAGERSRNHGLSRNIIQAQADALNIPILFCQASWQEYEDVFITALRDMKQQGITYGVFGDIPVDTLNHRQWADHVCCTTEIHAVEPLWNLTESDIAHEFFRSGIKAQIVAIKDQCLDSKYLGQFITPHIIQEFKDLGIHPFGEHGEYHTVVTNGPHFSSPLNLEHGDQILKDGYWFLDMSLKN